MKEYILDPKQLKKIFSAGEGEDPAVFLSLEEAVKLNRWTEVPGIIAFRKFI